MFTKARALFLFAIIISFPAISQDVATYRTKAEQYRTSGNTDSAIWYYKQAYRMLNSPGEQNDAFTQLCSRIGSLYFGLSDFYEAIRYFEEARMVSGILGDRTPEYANICNTLGVAYNLSGQLDTAVDRHERARTVRSLLFGKDTSAAYAQSCNNLGSVYRDLGRYNESESLLQEAYAIRKLIQPAGKAGVFAITCAALGHLYQDIGQYENAEKLYRESRNIRAEMKPEKQHPDYAAITNILADLLSYMQRREDAEELYLESLSIREKHGMDVSYAESCNNLAGLYRDWGKYSQALQYATRARLIFEKEVPEGNPARTINLNGLGEIYLAMGVLDTAKNYFYAARNYWNSQLDKDHPYLIANASQLIRLFRRENQPDSAHQLITSLSASQYLQVANVFQFTSENEKLAYLRNTKGSSDEFTSFYWRQYDHNRGGQAYTIALQNRNLVLSSLQASRQVVAESNDKELDKWFSLWSETKDQLAKIYQRGADRNTGFANQLQLRADSLERLIARKSGNRIETGLQKADWKEIQKNLKDGEAAIEFVTFQMHDGLSFLDSTYYAALVLRKEYTEPRMIGLFEERALVQQMNRKVVADKVRDSTVARGLRVTSAGGITQAVYEMTWKAIDPELKGIRRVYFAASGLLHRISFAALPIDSQVLLSDKYQLVQLSSTGSIASKRNRSVVESSDQLQLVGGVQYGFLTKEETNPGMSPFGYLHGTEAEVNDIGRLAKQKKYGVVTWQGSQATEEKIKTGTGTRAPDILHIATHGFFFPEPGKEGIGMKGCGTVFRGSYDPLWRSGLVLANGNKGWCGQYGEGENDGILTAYEVSGLSLVKTKLLVLSACETALGDVRGSEGVYGLQRAFSMAGVKNMVMSLWKVPDHETAEFMTVFYGLLFSGKPIDESFYETQETMKKKYRSQPYKWAAWILIR